MKMYEYKFQIDNVPMSICNCNHKNTSNIRCNTMEQKRVTHRRDVTRNSSVCMAIVAWCALPPFPPSPSIFCLCLSISVKTSQTFCIFCLFVWSVSACFVCRVCNAQRLGKVSVERVVVLLSDKAQRYLCSVRYICRIRNSHASNQKMSSRGGVARSVL